MHTLARRYIKTAVAFLAVGLAIGLWMLVRREVYGKSVMPFETSAHTHALVVGFMMQMIMGVALWLFPRPAKDDMQYRPVLANVAYWILSVATAARIVGELSRTTEAGYWIKLVVLAAGIGQAFAILLFFQMMWSRIRPLGSRTREQTGERF